MDLWRKNGGPPRDLPQDDIDASKQSWSDLANNPEGREACGWVRAPEYPEYDTATHKPVWGTTDWVIVPIVPQKVSRMQAKLALDEAGMLDAVETFMASAPPRVRIYWTEVSELHRNHPVLLEATTALGMTSQQVDELFTAAYAIV